MIRFETGEIECSVLQPGINNYIFYSIKGRAQFKRNIRNRNGTLQKKNGKKASGSPSVNVNGTDRKVPIPPQDGIPERSGLKIKSVLLHYSALQTKSQ